MFLSINWISDFVDLKGIDIDNLIHRFTLSTAEVEGFSHVGADIQNVVVGQILTVDAHPNSQKLHLLTVDGGDKIYHVVCGAPNVEVGLKVPFAKTGGHAGGMDIEARPVAGQMSEGMCCSEKELGLSDNHEGLMILPQDAPVGTDIKELYEIEDTIFEVDNKSLTNRPDLWGHYGIAREIAALVNRPLKPFAAVDLAQYQNLPKVPITVKTDDLLYRYSSLAFDSISVSTSPVNMRIRLYRCGMRAINLLADLTNYIMLELGQPMHAFDYKRVSRIEVGCYDKPFTFETLDGKERNISEKTLMIQSDGEPVAIAGIMGGLKSEIVADTDSFLLESATFDAVSIRKSAAAIGLRTDASMRYEKSLDPEKTLDAIARYVYLLQSIDPGARVISSLSDEYVKHFPVRVLPFDKAYLDRVTGIDIGWDQALDTFRKLGFSVKELGDSAAELTVPSWRATKDVTIQADLIEEVTRIYGYDNFEIKTARPAVVPTRYSRMHELTTAAKDMLAFSFNAHEVQTYIWNDGKRLEELGLPNDGYLTLTNAISPDISTIRKDIISSLLTVALKNRGYASRYSIFEIGSVCRGLLQEPENQKGLADEHKCLGIVLCGRASEEESLFDEAHQMVCSLGALLCNTKCTLRRLSETDASVPAWAHPYNCFEVLGGDKSLGLLSVVHPNVAAKIEKKSTAVAIELDMQALCDLTGPALAFEEPSKFPAVEADITFIVPSETEFAVLENSIRLTGSNLLKKYRLTGIYRDPAHPLQKSVTVRFTFALDDRTLSGEEVQNELDALIASARANGAQVNA